jgi:hypothetical protein
VTDQLLFRFSAFAKYWRKKWEYNETVHQLFVDFKKAHDSVRREVLYNILIEFGVPMKLVRLIRMCLNGIYSKAHIGKHLFSYPKWSETRRCSVTTAFQLCFRMCHYEDAGKPGGTEIEWDTSASGLRWCCEFPGR